MEKLPSELSPLQYNSLQELFTHFVTEHGDLNAFSCLGKTLTYEEVDRLSDNFAAYIQTHTELRAGDRVAIQLLNLLQFPITFYGLIKAGLIVVTTNPLYTSQEMLHQFSDSRVKGIVILDAFCEKLEEILPHTEISTVIVSRLGDMQSPLKSKMLNFGAKYLKRIVPAYNLPNSVSFETAISCQEKFIEPDGAGSDDNVALILYTGGTTGVSKGAMLSHSNLIANMMQLRSRCLLLIRDKLENIVAPLPLYHSYAFLLHCLAMPYAGNHNILIPNPRDLKSLIEVFRKFVVNGFVGINTLYLALLQNKEFKSLNFDCLKFCGAGGMAMSTSVSKEWETVTGCEIIEGYGLTECSPVVSVNIPGKVRSGTVGHLVPETECKVVDDENIEVESGERGELWVRGPQVMLGYWSKSGAREKTYSSLDWFKTGDLVEINEDGYITIVDRKKDMILVSGFNVFPNEVEDWVNQYPAVLESAAIGVACEKTGELIRLFVVVSEAGVTEEELLSHCRKGLTAYKVPKEILFVKELPKSNIGKILRRELRKQTI
ncbi:MAG: long-chain fatty acid--CoA ligase [Gammaproteobacteria bacterium]|nr:long-chain fatty acid--CoA ligase [Gammaproteobacteria bacterium]